MADRFIGSSEVNLCRKGMSEASESAQHEDGGLKRMKKEIGELFLGWELDRLRNMGRPSLRRVKKRMKVFGVGRIVVCDVH